MKQSCGKENSHVVGFFCMGGSVASWLVRSTPEQSVGVFLGKTLYSHSASLQPGV